MPEAVAPPPARQRQQQQLQRQQEWWEQTFFFDSCFGSLAVASSSGPLKTDLPPNLKILVRHLAERRGNRDGTHLLPHKWRIPSIQNPNPSPYFPTPTYRFLVPKLTPRPLTFRSSWENQNKWADRALFGFNIGMLISVITKFYNPMSVWSEHREGKFRGAWNPNWLPTMLAFVQGLEMIWLMIAIAKPFVVAFGWIIGLANWPNPFFGSTNWAVWWHFPFALALAQVYIATRYLYNQDPSTPMSQYRNYIYLPLAFILLILTQLSTSGTFFSLFKGIVVETPLDAPQLERMWMFWWSNWTWTLLVDGGVWVVFRGVEKFVKGRIGREGSDSKRVMMAIGIAFLLHYLSIGSLALPLADPTGAKLYQRFYSFLDPDIYFSYVRPRIAFAALGASFHVRSVVRDELERSVKDSSSSRRD
ncbi:hypothetical protein T439DRAFT_345372 [Meredithblackwellia eburnea MCA 4105]